MRTCTHMHTHTGMHIFVRSSCSFVFCVVFVCICMNVYVWIYYVHAHACSKLVLAWVREFTCLCLYLFADHLGVAFIKRGDVFGKIALHTRKYIFMLIRPVIALRIWPAYASLCRLVGPRAAFTCEHTRCTWCVWLFSHNEFTCTLRCTQRIYLFEKSERWLFVCWGGLCASCHLQSKHPDCHRHYSARVT